MINLEESFTSQSAEWPSDRKAAHILAAWGLGLIDNNKNLKTPHIIFATMLSDPYNLKPASELDTKTYAAMPAPEKLNALALEDILRTKKIGIELCLELNHYAEFGDVLENGPMASKVLNSGYSKTSDESLLNKTKGLLHAVFR